MPYSQGNLPYAAGRLLARFVWLCTMNARTLGEENLSQPGGYLLASNHFNHVDPLLLSALHRRPIDWMTRIEFFKYQIIARLLRRLRAFPVNRQGVSVSAIRTAMARVAAGRIVGICPEGGVMAGRESACRGAPIKQGVCLISCRSGVPIIPCVILGSHTLSRVGPWLPAKRARIWIAFGQPLYPPANITHHKAARHALTMELQKRFVQLYEQLIQEFALDQNDVG